MLLLESSGDLIFNYLMWVCLPLNVLQKSARENCQQPQPYPYPDGFAFNDAAASSELSNQVDKLK